MSSLGNNRPVHSTHSPSPGLLLCVISCVIYTQERGRRRVDGLIIIDPPPSFTRWLVHIIDPPEPDQGQIRARSEPDQGQFVCLQCNMLGTGD